MDHKRLFSWNFAKADLVSCQFGFNFTHCPAQSTSKMICLFFALFLALNLLSSYFNPARPSLLSFPVAGNSHNCRPKFPSIAGGSGVWLGQA